MNAGEAGSLVAKYLNLHWPHSKEEIFEILTLAQESFWKSGRWHGSTGEFFVNVQDGVIYSPPGYDTLLAVKLNERPAMLVDNFYRYHRNAISLECGCPKEWSDQVQDLGYSPVMIQPKNHKILVRSRENESVNSDRQPTLKIDGTNQNGEPIITYISKCNESPTGYMMQTCGIGENQTIEQKAKVVHGALFYLNQKGIVYNNIRFNSITQIRKSVTKGPVDVFLVKEFEDGSTRNKRIATLMPWEETVRYRAWKIPQQCCDYPCVKGIFKVAKPSRIVYETQPILVNDTRALILMCKAEQEALDKNNFLVADRLRSEALRDYELDELESSAPIHAPIQVNIVSNHAGGAFDFFNNQI